MGDKVSSGDTFVHTFEADTQTISGAHRFCPRLINGAPRVLCCGLRASSSCRGRVGDSSPPQAPLVQTAASRLHPHTTRISQEVCEAVGVGHPSGPDLLPSGLHLFKCLK